MRYAIAIEQLSLGLSIYGLKCPRRHCMRREKPIPVSFVDAFRWVFGNQEIMKNDCE